MTDGPVNDALEQVRQMQAVVGDRMRFQGFSARARMAGGFVAIAGAIVVSQGGALFFASVGQQVDGPLFHRGSDKAVERSLIAHVAGVKHLAQAA